jgi:FtsH-binding integral membrane protein
MGVLVDISFFVLVFASIIPSVAAFDAGDAIALILGLAIGILGICACLGYYARRKSGV